MFKLKTFTYITMLLKPCWFTSKVNWKKHLGVLHHDVYMFSCFHLRKDFYLLIFSFCLLSLVVCRFCYDGLKFVTKRILGIHRSSDPNVTPPWQLKSSTWFEDIIAVCSTTSDYLSQPSPSVLSVDMLDMWIDRIVVVCVCPATHGITAWNTDRF